MDGGTIEREQAGAQEAALGPAGVAGRAGRAVGRSQPGELTAALACALALPLLLPMLAMPFGVHAALPGWAPLVLAGVVQADAGLAQAS